MGRFNARANKKKRLKFTPKYQLSFKKLKNVVRPRRFLPHFYFPLQSTTIPRDGNHLLCAPIYIRIHITSFIQKPKKKLILLTSRSRPTSTPIQCIKNIDSEIWLRFFLSLFSFNRLGEENKTDIQRVGKSGKCIFTFRH